MSLTSRLSKMDYKVGATIPKRGHVKERTSLVFELLGGMFIKIT